jgi:quercetin dioxygenase-like cupin family protein
MTLLDDKPSLAHPLLVDAMPTEANANRDNATIDNSPVELSEGLAYFKADHDALEPALHTLSDCATHNTLPGILLIQHIYDHMAEHFGLEEQALFPHVPFLPSAVLLIAEHDDLWRLWYAMQQACTQDAIDWPTHVNTFVARMRGHMHEENACLLPACERDMTAMAKRAVARALEALQTPPNRQWQPRPVIARGVTHLADAAPHNPQKLSCTVQHNCQVVWVTMPKAQGMKTHVSPHAQTWVVLSGTVTAESLEWSGTLLPGEGLAVDPVVPISLTAKRNAQLLCIKQPVVLPAGLT